MLWRFSQFESVRLVAQNVDILELLLAELEPMFQYNRVVNEYNDPLHKAHFKRVFKQADKPGHFKSHDRVVHPGRWFVHIVYPQLTNWPYWVTKEFKSEYINLYGFIIESRYRNTNYVLNSDSMRSFTHDDLNQMLASLGYKKFSSKKKHEKIHMLMKH